MPLSPNAELITRVFEDVAKGDGASFWAAASDDMVWRAPGTNSWGGAYRGKQAIIDQLFRPLRRILSSQATIPTRIIDGGDFVVVQARGRNITHDGRPYENDYCFVIRFQDGKMVEYEEYMDTEMAERVLGPRPTP